jgi:hypothetical protein
MGFGFLALCSVTAQLGCGDDGGPSNDAARIDAAPSGSSDAGSCMEIAVGFSNALAAGLDDFDSCETAADCTTVDVTATCGGGGSLTTCPIPVAVESSAAFEAWAVALGADHCVAGCRGGASCARLPVVCDAGRCRYQPGM